MSEMQARSEALRQALLVAKPNEKVEATIARAEAFFAFLRPGTVSERSTVNANYDKMFKAVGELNKAGKKAPAAPRKRGRPRKT